MCAYTYAYVYMRVPRIGMEGASCPDADMRRALITETRIETAVHNGAGKVSDKRSSANHEGGLHTISSVAHRPDRFT